MQAWALEQRRAGRSMGLVPTMGSLHDGHLSLVKRCQAENDLCVVSLFVNPAQFGPAEDFEHYPRDMSRDTELLEILETDVLFAPAAEAVYPPGFSTYVEETVLSKPLCGASRPGHFRGVTTVVLKLFNLVQPARAYFGQKDAQQARVIMQMVRDLDVPVEIMMLPTVREPDGLAMSSRNWYLEPDERREAKVLYEALEWARSTVDNGERSADSVVRGVRRMIEAMPSAREEYVAAVDFDTLDECEVLRGTVLIAVAVFFGTTRLIDNVIIRVEPTEESDNS